MKRKIEKIDDLVIGKPIQATLDNNETVFIVTFGEGEPSTMIAAKGEQITGRVLVVDHENEQISIQEPGGIVKVIKWIDFAFYLLPIIKQLLLMLKELFRPSPPDSIQNDIERGLYLTAFNLMDKMDNESIAALVEKGCTWKDIQGMAEMRESLKDVTFVENDGSLLSEKLMKLRKHNFEPTKRWGLFEDSMNYANRTPEQIEKDYQDFKIGYKKHLDKMIKEIGDINDRDAHIEKIQYFDRIIHLDGIKDQRDSEIAQAKEKEWFWTGGKDSLAYRYSKEEERERFKTGH